MGKAESQSKIGETTDLGNIKDVLDALEVKIDNINKALSSIGTDSWRVQTV